MDGAAPVKGSTAQKRLSMDFLVSLMVLCARRASRMSKKLRAKPTRKQPQSEEFSKSPVVGRRGGSDWTPASTPPRSPLRAARPKEMLMNLSNKAMTLVNQKRTRGAKAETSDDTTEEEEYGVWQREILMGDKCQPLDFSGAIYYDSHGRQLKDVPPRSPRASPLRSFQTGGYVGSPLNATIAKDSSTTESI